MQRTLDLDGYDHGPLFQHGRIKRAPKRSPGSTTMPGILRRSAERRATPAWANRAAVEAFWHAARRMTRAVGVVYSVDHIVPLTHPLVCGLHCEHNLEITTLLANLQKANNHWPDMWGEQAELDL